jgi:hypothetical protein
MALSEVDIKRTADWLVINNGVMFHTNYSLIWVLMLYDTYMFTGNKELVCYCLRALKTLMSKFKSYLGDNGLMEKAPNYMFVDHVTRDGYTLHHPPKYLGQSVLTAFYYGALNTAAEIYRIVDDEASAKEMLETAAIVKRGFNENLYDEEVGLYFEGLGTPDLVPTYAELPENQNKKFFAQYANIFACLFGLCEGEKAKDIMRRVVTDENLDDIEPYNFHWKFEALSKVGLFDEYALEMIERWKPLVKECSKGLKEGWKDPKGYGYDYSHSWGGTPCYQLPAKTLGFKMIEPGFKKISLSPNLLGLESAEITMPTPYGYIVCKLEKGKAPDITVPEEIEYEII